MSANPFDVIIVGAGAAGLTAAYDLVAAGSSFHIVEANTRLGGRLEKLEGFTDFPLDIGGEWIHTDPSTILPKIANQATRPMPPTIPYRPEYHYLDEDGQWAFEEWSKPDDYKFVGSTWFDFFNDYIAHEDVKRNISYGCVVDSIDYTSLPVVVSADCGAQNQQQWRANKVIVTASVKILQDRLISFKPQLPTEYMDAIDNRMEMLSGLKVFLKFREPFYGSRDAFALDIDTSSFNDRFFFDETFGQSSNDNILGVFILGAHADRYVEQSDTQIVSSLIAELDGVFNGQASGNLLLSAVKNWNKDEYVRGAYIRTINGFCWIPIDVLREPVDNKIFFAGEAVPDDGDEYEWGSADVAALSGRSAARKAMATS